ncbi:exported hypothetical protein [Gammaproteobacteria bacterium]
MFRITIKYLAKLFVAIIYATISLPVSAEVAEGNLVPTGTVQLQCWQYGTKIIDEKGLHQQSISSLGEPGFMRFNRGKDTGDTVLLVPTTNSICLIKNER